MVCGASFKTFMFFMVKGCCLDALGPLAVASDHFEHRLSSEFDYLDGYALVGRASRSTCHSRTYLAKRAGERKNGSLPECVPCLPAERG